MIKLSIKTKFMRAATMLLLMLFTTTTAWAQEKKTPVVTTPPTASAITYGQMLAESTLSGGTVTGENNEVVSGTWTWVSATTMPNVSDSGTTEYSVVFTPTDTGNYDSFTTKTTLTINKAPLTITANSKSINYGDAPANDGVTYGEFVNGENKDNLGGTLGFEYDYSQGDPVGTYQITPNGLTSVNYAITFVPGTLTVDKKSLTVAADDITIDHGAAAPAYTYSVTGLVNGESLTTEPTLSSTYTQGAGIGTYPISISGAAASANYTISYTPGTLTVQSKKYTVTFVDEDGTTVLKEGEEYEYGTAAADIVKPADPTKDATAQYTYTFAGWDPEIAMVTGDATYTATYSSTAVSYNINYVLYGGTNNPSNPTTYTCESAITLAEPTAPENSGYTFSGWYTDANFENSVDDTAIPQGTTGEMTFYACWLKELTATAVWDDDNNKYGVRPGDVTFGLSDGTNEKEYIVSNDGNLATIFCILPVHKNGEEIVYTWRIRDNSGCYEQSAPVVDGNTTTFTLTLKTHDYCGTDDPKTTDVDESVNVTWNYNTSTKTITIAGSGPMMYYNSVQNGENWNNGAPWRAFAGEIEHVVISDGITYVGSNTFAHCPNISSVTLPTDQHLYEIGPGAFGNCTSLTSIDIPMSVNKINGGAFAGCSNLASVTLGYGDGATFTIGTDVFPATTTILVPATGLLSYLGADGWSDYADKLISTGYCGKDNAETTNVDESRNLIWTLRAITKTTDQGMTLETVTVDDKVLAALKLTVSANTADPVNPDAEEAFDMAVLIPGDIGKPAIYPFGTSDDEYISAIRDIVIGDGVTSIGNMVFRFPDAMKNINATIGKDVKTIDSGAFHGTNLANVTFAENSTLETIGYQAFRLTDLTNITIPASVKTIGGEAFMDCQQLETVTIEDSSTKPSQLTSIGGNAFTGTKITTITLPKSVKDIDDAFRGCTTLQTVNFAADATIETIGYGAFLGCTSLQSITIPASVTMIDYDVFLNCTSLAAVNFAQGSALKDVSASAFDGCTKLTETNYVLNLPTTVTDVFSPRPSHLVSCLAAKLWSNATEKLSCSGSCGVEVLQYNPDVIINSANNVQFTMRSNGTLSDNSPALRMKIYKNTENPTGSNFSIADCSDAESTRWADARTSITVVEVGEGVTGIGNNAFAGCSALKTFRVKPTTAPVLGTNVFDGCTALTIIAPASYKTADGWKSEGIVEKLRADREDLFTGGTEWMTWCNDLDWSAPAGCKVYVVGSVDESTVTLTALTETANADRTEGEENAEGIRIPAYTPVILQKTVANATGLQARFAKVGTVPTSGYNATTGLVTQSESNFNMLGNATDAAISEGGFTEQPFYSLYNGKFYRYEGTQAIAAHRCILTVSPVYTAPVLTIGTETTSLVSIDNGQLIIDNDVWYTLDGRKLNGKPTKKGLYIHNGRKVVIK